MPTTTAAPLPQLITKDEAIAKMQAGFRVSHPGFGPGEYIALTENGHIIDEGGWGFGKIGGSFFKSKTDKYWLNDWIVVGKNKNE